MKLGDTDVQCEMDTVEYGDTLGDEVMDTLEDIVSVQEMLDVPRWLMDGVEEPERLAVRLEVTLMDRQTVTEMEVEIVLVALMVMLGLALVDAQVDTVKVPLLCEALSVRCELLEIEMEGDTEMERHSESEIEGDMEDEREAIDREMSAE